ncbi:MAG: 4-hydroxy-tetrahydrodipicolinate synthase [Bacteroidetes bacterium]|nr:4-hydroxy-tetrahydrodipicolinate synthase [Bacteroidota bacterium]
MIHPLTTKLKGTGVAVVTPFKKNSSIDFNAFEKIIDHLIAGEIEYLVVMGTTGESPTLSKEEKKTLIEFSVEKVRSRVPLVIGIGGNSTSDVVLNIHATQFKGVDAILSVSPYYNKPQQTGLYEHFKTIAEASPVPVILYNVPGRTGSNMQAETTIRLATNNTNIIGIKEASGNFDQIFRILKSKPDNFLVISGDDGITLPLLAAGIDGLISVAANAYPREISEMVRAGLRGDFQKAREIHFQLFDFMNAMFMDGSPGGIKAALEIKQFCFNILRLPLVSVNKDTYNLIKKVTDQIEKL